MELKRKTTEKRDKNSFTILEVIVASLLLFTMSSVLSNFFTHQTSYDKYNQLNEIENHYYQNHKNDFIYDKDGIYLSKTSLP